MTEIDDDQTLFPPEWGWEKYAPAMREFAAQIARHSTALERLSPLEQEANNKLIGLWWGRAIDDGRLPTFDERTNHEDQYLEILGSLVDHAKQKLEQGTLAIGVENLLLYPHLMKEYEESLENNDNLPGALIDDRKVTITESYPDIDLRLHGFVNRYPDYRFEARLYDVPSKFGINRGRIYQLSVWENDQPVINYSLGWQDRPRTFKQRRVLREIEEGFPGVKAKRQPLLERVLPPHRHNMTDEQSDQQYEKDEERHTELTRKQAAFARRFRARRQRGRDFHREP